MAQKKASLLVTLEDKASKGVSTLNTGFTKLASVVKVGAVAAFTAFSAALAISIKNAVVQENAVNELTEAMKNNGTFTAKARDEALEYAAALQKQTTFGDESIIVAQKQLVQLAKLEGYGLKKATKATLDLAAATGMDLKAAAQLVGKSLGSSTNALARYGVQVSGTVGSQERLNELVENAADLFGGSAAAQAKTFSGQMQQLKNRLGDIAEVIGIRLIPIIEDRLLPVLDTWLTKIENLFEKWDAKAIARLEKEEEEAQKRLEIAQNALSQLEEGEGVLQRKILGYIIERQQKRLDAAKKELATFRKTEDQKAAIRKKHQKQEATAREEHQENMAALHEEFTDLLVQNEGNALRAMGIQLKRHLIAEINARAAKEIGDALIRAPLTLGGTLAAVAPIVAAQAAGVAAVSAVKFHQGGMVDNVAVGEETPAVLQGGERVLSIEQNDQMISLLQSIDRRLSGGRGNIVVMLDGKELAASTAKYMDSFQNLNNAGVI